MRLMNAGHVRPEPDHEEKIAADVADFWLWFDERMQEREELERQLPDPRMDADPVELTQLVNDEDIIWE